MTDEEVMTELGSNSRWDFARAAFSHQVGRLEQAEQQRRPLTPIDRRRLEFEAIKIIARELGVDL